MSKYSPKTIEPKWQAYWEKNKTFKVMEDPDKPKVSTASTCFLILRGGVACGSSRRLHSNRYPLPIQTGTGGFIVLHPMGWDAFGYLHNMRFKLVPIPAITTRTNIENFTRQIKALGFSYDWDREVNTTDPDYYRWTQWIFAELIERG